RGSKALQSNPYLLTLLRIELAPDAGGELDPTQYRLHIQVNANRTIRTRLGHLSISNAPEKALELQPKGVLVRPLHRVPLLQDEVGYGGQRTDGAGERPLPEDHLLHNARSRS